jgi:hypothetical protein
VILRDQIIIATRVELVRNSIELLGELDEQGHLTALDLAPIFESEGFTKLERHFHSEVCANCAELQKRKGKR